VRHLILCREYPPSPYAAGGIGTYVHHIARLLAEAGETVHVIGQQWAGAPQATERRHDGRLTIHRVPLDEPVAVPWHENDPETAKVALAGMLRSESPWQTFSWQASLLAESIVEREHIDVVEAQEYEAPLYFFQLRRVLGLGPAHRPPCIVHLHSPTEFIFRHNGWDMGRADYLPIKRLEDYSILAADALLCPSRYLAAQVEVHHGLERGTVHVLPYPIGDTPVVERAPETWSGSTLCYVGRLEPRKGVVEYVEAAVAVARERGDVRFEFVGSDTSLSGTGGVTVQKFVSTRIPEELKDRFIFHGAKDRSALPALLGRAFAAVVPSRWENFPNTCIEAMCSGMPVVASPAGGMAEMIEDGRTGWLAASVAPRDLADALRRALDTPAAERAGMGREASVAVRRLCDNQATVRRQIEFRQALARRGPKRSLAIPALLRSDDARVAATTAPVPLASPAGGVAVIALASGDAESVRATLASIEGQTRPAAAVVVVAEQANAAVVEPALAEARARGWHVLVSDADRVSASNAALRLLLEDRALLAIAFVNARTRLRPEFVVACERVLGTCADVGIVSAWTRVRNGEDAVRIRPCPAFPYQWISNEVAQYAAIRSAALADTGLLRPELNSGFETWDLVNAVLAGGWAAVTYPAILGEESGAVAGVPEARDATYEATRRALLTRFSDLIGRHAAELVLLLETGSPWSGPYSERRARQGGPNLVAQVLTPGRVLSAPFHEKMALVRRALKHPDEAARWLKWQAGRALARVTVRARGSEVSAPGGERSKARSNESV
jgi:glycosyltransferase involved in cell wall biosynthesis